MSKMEDRLELIGLILGFIFSAMWLSLGILAALNPLNQILLQFNRWHELPADIAVFTVFTGLTGWLVIRKFRQ